MTLFSLLPRELRHMLVERLHPGMRFLLRQLDDFASFAAVQAATEEDLFVFAVLADRVGLLNSLRAAPAVTSFWRPWRGAVPDWFRPRAMNTAVRHGRLAIVKWLAARACPYLPEHVLEIAAEEGHLGIVDWLVAQGCYVDYTSLWCAAAKGHLEVLDLLLKRGVVPVDLPKLVRFLCQARSVHMRPMLSWLHRNGFDIKAMAMVEAQRARDDPLQRWIRRLN